VTQNDRVLAYLRAHPGSTAMELSLGIEPYISNVRARISDLRLTHGIEIEARKREDGRVGFFVVQPGQQALGLLAS
jgi:hypothetical protein